MDRVRDGLFLYDSFTNFLLHLYGGTCLIDDGVGQILRASHDWDAFRAFEQVYVMGLAEFIGQMKL